MIIQLTPQESEQCFHNALCNGLDWISNYGLTLEYEDKDYQTAKATLQAQSPTLEICYEDVLMEILKSGGTLTLVDEEGGEDDAQIKISEVHERVSKTPMVHLMNMITENDDAETADVILQTVFLGEVIYG